MISDRQRLAVTTDSSGGNGNGNKYLKSGGREALVGVGGRRDGKCVSGSTVLGGDTRQRQGLCKRSMETQYCHFLCLTRPGGEAYSRGEGGEGKKGS